MTVVVEPLEPPELFDWFVKLREDLGMTVVPLGEAASVVLRALADNRVVGLLTDRDLAGNGVEVELFGAKTTLPGGPAVLALRSGAALLPTAVFALPRGQHVSVVRPPVCLERRGSFRSDVSRITQDLAHELEVLISRAPEQWHLFQPNWPEDRD
jgi:phosphatidylinositol dimannoside acyltransferase